jgi:transcriptional regulator with XRE-family HTH domain
MNTQELRSDLLDSLGASDEERRRRSELRDFLRNARERINPAIYKFEVDRRRRATGLRREEVAHLAGVSTGWYTLLETARNRRVSTRMLDRVARVLMLSDTEKLRLYTLAFPEIPSISESLETPDPECLRLLRTFIAQVRNQQTIESVGWQLVDFLSRRCRGAADFAFLVRSQSDGTFEWVETSQNAARFAGLAVVGETPSAEQWDEAILLYGLGRHEAIPEADVERAILACEIAACRLDLVSGASTVRVMLSANECFTARAMRFVAADTSAPKPRRLAAATRTPTPSGDVAPLLRR